MSGLKASSNGMGASMHSTMATLTYKYPSVLVKRYFMKLIVNERQWLGKVLDVSHIFLMILNHMAPSIPQRRPITFPDSVNKRIFA